MAAFDPATIQLLREQLRETNAQHKRDLNRRNKHDVLSRSLMAQKLDSRIAESVAVARDLDRLIAFAEGVNRLYADHDAGLHASVQRFDCPVCIEDDRARSSAVKDGVR